MLIAKAHRQTDPTKDNMLSSSNCNGHLLALQAACKAQQHQASIKMITTTTPTTTTTTTATATLFVNRLVPPVTN